MRRHSPEFRDERDLPVIVPLPRDGRHRVAGAVGDRRQSSRASASPPWPILELDRRVPEYPAHAPRPRRRGAHVTPRALERGIERRLQRVIADDIAQRRNAVLVRRKLRICPKPPACEMSMRTIGVNASGHVRQRIPDVQSLQDEARAVRHRERAITAGRLARPRVRRGRSLRCRRPQARAPASSRPGRRRRRRHHAASRDACAPRRFAAGGRRRDVLQRVAALTCGTPPRHRPPISAPPASGSRFRSR